MSTFPPGLVTTVDGLVSHYGLAEVHAYLRSLDGFCANCGCVVKPGESHQPEGLGSCWLVPIPVPEEQL